MTNESTLTTPYATLRRFIGREMGWSRDPFEWDDDQVTDGDDMIASGCRAAYYPASGYSWSFLRPNFTVDVVADRKEYDLPYFFAGLVGDLTFSKDDDASHIVTERSDQYIRARYANDHSLTSGYPLEFCVRQDPPTSDMASRSRIVLWPTPDAEYHLTGQCIVQPNTITSDMPYAYGDAAFHECLLNAILMQCERRLGENTGKYAEAFAESLAAAQRVDANRQPGNLGYNRDLSDQPSWSWRENRYGTVTYTPR